MKNKTAEKLTARHSERGLTAVELLVSMAIFLIVVGAVYGVLKIGNLSRTSINSRSENIKNVRMAINSIGREAVNAGLGYNRIGGTVPDDFTSENFGLPADADDDDDLLTAISSGFDISESNLTKKGTKNDVVAFAFRDFQFNDGFPVIINDVQKQNGNLVLRTPDGACANCRPYDLFLIETGDGKKAIILSTDIVGNNTIVLGDDPLGTNYGKDYKGDDNSGQGKGHDKNKICLPGHYGHPHCTNPPGINISVGGGGIGIGIGGIGIGIGGGSGSSSGKTDKSTVKKCEKGKTENCLDYSTTTIVAKKIYLVNYSVSADGTLIRTTFGNNTGAGADEQIVQQPIASGVRSFKLKYLLADGTTTEDPSVANTQKERCNDIIQIEVTVVVDAENGSSEPISLTSTFSTRNLKYDVY